MCLYREYGCDADKIKKCIKAQKAPQKLHDFLDKYLYGMKDRWEYLSLVWRLSRLRTLRANTILGH
jgi:hypothetical protein